MLADLDEVPGGRKPYAGAMLIDGGVKDLRHEPAPAWLTWCHRLGVALMVLLLLGGLLGLGGGPGLWSEGRQGPLRYQRTARAYGTTTWRLALPAGPARLWLSAEAVDGLQLVSCLPAPASQRVVPDGLVLGFEGRGGELRLDLRPRTAGLWRPRLRLDDGPLLAPDQWVWP